MRGFTLVETIIVISLTALVSLTLGFVLQYFYKTEAYTLQQSEAVASARSGVENAMATLREASYGADGSYPIVTAATSSITFYADVDNDGVVEKVSYFLSAGSFYRTVVNPAGNPPSYVGQAAATTTIANYVINGTSSPVFTYFDSSGNQLSSPVNLSEVASVQTSVTVDVDLNRAPVAFTLTAGATLRNLRDQTQ